MNGIALFAALAAARQLVYPGAEFGTRPLPKFDKGYLLFLGMSCEVTAFGPTGQRLFEQTVRGPGGLPCSNLDAAVDTDGTVAVSIGHRVPAGYASGIVMLDPAGRQTVFIETGRYIPANIGFDRHHSLWSIGWQRGEIRNDTADTNDYNMVRRYSRAGKETGAFLPRSLWKTTGEPPGGAHGYWRMAVASDRVGAVVYENFFERTPEWIEWDFEGKLISRIPFDTAKMQGGRAYTAGGRLYGGIWDSERKVVELGLLDRETGAWKRVDKQPFDQWKLLLGADGDDLVFKEPYGGTELIWTNPGQ